ncbi:CPBP family intramembrane glutamic endopeptidase [Flammeovirga sp. EKP202]|uniref:CPBP family intramembrane glutamic endopeptidase n=1 Tax=Flammeovirga sp. EKP202 TaxID=2770592 RepID=UPI00165FA240|nr:CPBP family intramembrane glutamic endopeptidase [Flammeovirga sp. EKP202]MBD0402404.1 CPBP family intramembrane metalloprotease [Flammeovirga sp. EKP202]
MTDHIQAQNPGYFFKKFLLLILFVIMATFVGQAVIVGVLLPLYDFSVQEVFNQLSHKDNRMVMLTVQGISALFTFILGPLTYGYFYDPKFTEQLSKKLPEKSQLLLSMIVIAVFLPLGSALLVWNQNIELPAAFHDLEVIMKETELHLAKLTIFLVDFQSFPEFLVGFLVIAIFAGVGEELLFRGYVQGYIEGMFKNAHLAIWATAFIFSAIHLQFYGFFVRMFLGVLLGYLFLWSGRSLYPAILAHITNNAITVISVYVNKEEILKEMADPFSTEAPEWYIVILSTIFAFGFLFFYKKRGEKLSFDH